ncbi:M35 family metallo-endopeptidase [Flocculibacter collagenilyticus]|uniref:M35 family metallo-endopeptidase n=1 Tax=Flocculibacter collagenilyticus TaxID=2744479 RepID=UPI0018F3D6C3|nr:M35 family metallo-endopeptidase [Flocculibacter collagenilyticus]
MKIIKTLALFGVAVSLLLSTSVFAKVHSGIEVTLKPHHQTLGNDQNIYVDVKVKNRTGGSVKVLKWFLPDDMGEIEDDLFKVTLNGKPVDYLGRHYKRPAPTDGDYVIFKKNEMRHYRVELSGVYDFTEQGQYEVVLNVRSYNLFSPSMAIQKADSNTAFTQLKSNSAVTIYVDKMRTAKRCNPRKEDCSGGGGTDDVSFTGACSNSEQNSIMSALSSAKTMANDSVSYLNGSAGPRYDTWFGSYSSSRWNTVASNFDAVKDALDNKPKTFDCSCNQSYYAYVYPSQPYKVYLCRAFWNAPTTGTDSKAGTIIHELSHFNVVAGTDDIVYGQTGAQNLANSNPNQAVQNADSHEYFAENTPYQN